jgi:hypothetical protein
LFLMVIYIIHSNLTCTPNLLHKFD